MNRRIESGCRTGLGWSFAEGGVRYAVAYRTAICATQR